MITALPQTQQQTDMRWEPGYWNDLIVLGGTVGAFLLWVWRHTALAALIWFYNCIKAPQRLAEMAEEMRLMQREHAEDMALIRHKLHTAAARARVTWDCLPYAMWESDALGLCVHVNCCYREMLGYQFSEVSGTQWKQVIHPDFKAAVFAEWDSCVKDKRPFNMRYDWVSKHGERIPIHAQASPLLDADQQITGWVAFVTDLRRC